MSLEIRDCPKCNGVWTYVIGEGCSECDNVDIGNLWTERTKVKTREKYKGFRKDEDN